MKNLAKKNGKKDLVVGNISADLIMSNAGKGLENITSEDITIPRLSVIQSNSPQRKKKDEKYSMFGLQSAFEIGFWRVAISVEISIY